MPPPILCSAPTTAAALIMACGQTQRALQRVPHSSQHVSLNVPPAGVSVSFVDFRRLEPMHGTYVWRSCLSSPLVVTSSRVLSVHTKPKQREGEEVLSSRGVFESGVTDASQPSRHSGASAGQSFACERWQAPAGSPRHTTCRSRSACATINWRCECVGGWVRLMACGGCERARASEDEWCMRCQSRWQSAREVGVSATVRVSVCMRQ